jgi:hypothetical protein
VLHEWSSGIGGFEGTPLSQSSWSQSAAVAGTLLSSIWIVSTPPTQTCAWQLPWVCAASGVGVPSAAGVVMQT